MVVILVVVLLIVLGLPFVLSVGFPERGGEEMRGGLIPILVVIILVIVAILLLQRLL